MDSGFRGRARLISHGQGAVPACNTTACVSGSDYTTFTWVTVPVSPPVSVTANTQYVIELSATNANLDIYGSMTGRTVNRYEWAGVDNEFTYDFGGVQPRGQKPLGSTNPTGRSRRT